jgi:O-antigen ligase
LYATVGLEQGVREALRVLSVLAAFLVVYWWCRDAGHYRRGWIYLGAGALIPIGVSLWQLATGAGFSDIEGVYRIQGTFSHPNAYSQYLVAFIIVGVATLTSQRGILRAWIAVVTVGCTILVLLSYTRTAILALVVGLISLPVLQAPRLGYKTVLRTTVVLLLLGVLIWATGSEMIRERLSTLSLGRDALISAELGESENSFQWRLLNWGILISMGMEHPIAGHGAGMTTVLNPLSADNGVPFNAHDDFVRFFFEGGIVGLLLFTLYSVLICLWVVRRSRLVSPESRGSALGVAAAFLALGLMTGGTTELSLQTADLYQLYGMLALVAALPIVVIPTPHAANVTHVLHHLSRWQGGSE